jgi:hypothetical protein
LQFTYAQATGEAFFQCLWVIFALLDPDQDCESPGIPLNPDPDPQHWFKLNPAFLILFCSSTLFESLCQATPTNENALCSATAGCYCIVIYAFFLFQSCSVSHLSLNSSVQLLSLEKQMLSQTHPFCIYFIQPHPKGNSDLFSYRYSQYLLDSKC